MAQAGMNNLQRYFENEVNVPHTVLGWQLQPLSLRHMMWLQHLESPLLNTDKVTTLQDLELAVLVCSSKSHEETLSNLGIKPGKGLLKRCRWEMRKKALNWWCASNRKKISTGKALQDEIRKFLAYQDDYCCLPSFTPKDSQATHEKVPYLLVYAAALIKSTGWSEETVFNMPVGKVIWFNTTFGYLNTGETNILSDKERHAMEMLKQISKPE